MALITERQWSSRTSNGEAWAEWTIDDVALRVVSVRFFNPGAEALTFRMADDLPNSQVDTRTMPANMTQPQTLNVPNNRDYTFTMVRAVEMDGTPAVDENGQPVFDRVPNFPGFTFIGPAAARQG